MSAVIPLTSENASPQAADIFAGIEKKFGIVQNIFRVMGHHAGVLGGFLKLSEAIHTDLDPQLRELAFLHVSVLNSCDYCTHHHKAAAKAAGVSAEKIDAVINERLEEFDGLELDVLRFADQLTLNTRVEDDVAGRIRESLSDSQYVALAATVGVANWTNRFNHACGVELP
ncbi:carboxymuconolactone decarboxylase family protein [bacterium]|nr:carboxymuconolactone decarboxylase family protein [bacterium]